MRFMPDSISSLLFSGTALTREAMYFLTPVLVQTFLTIGWMVLIRWVEIPPMENRKLGQGGWKGSTQNVIAVEDQTPRWRRRFACSSDRLKIRKTVGEHLSFTVSPLGMGADTSTSIDLVISDAAVNMSSRMTSWLAGSCASPSKGWARILLPWSCSHSAARSMFIYSKTVVGYASCTMGSGPGVYLSRAFRGVYLPTGTLILLAAASRRFLVEEGTRIGASGGAMFVGASPISGASRLVMAGWGVTPLGKGRPTSVTRGMGTSPFGSGGKEHWRVGVVRDVPGSSSKKSMVGKGGGVSSWSEDWYMTMGWACWSCIASMGMEMDVIAPDESCASLEGEGEADCISSACGGVVSSGLVSARVEVCTIRGLLAFSDF